MDILVQFSGGKDSLATLIYAVENYGKKVKAVFCDTKWEHDFTYEHINEVIEKLGVELITLTSKKFDGLVGMAKDKKRFPSRKARFCTEELKVIPFIDYILDNNNDVLIFQGIRKDESIARSKMENQCSFFKYYFEPYGYNKKGKPLFHSYRKKEVLKFCLEHSHDVIRPIFLWNVKQLFDYIHLKGFSVNKLYYRGFSRVGCFPCIMARHNEIKSIIEFEPQIIDKIRDSEILVGRTFFPPKYIPKHACSNKQYPTIDDVVKYSNGKNETLEIFEKPNSKCSSFYSLCE